jgi:hypothetical protein
MDKAVLGRNVPETLTRALHVLSRVSENLRFEAKDLLRRAKLGAVWKQRGGNCYGQR